MTRILLATVLIVCGISAVVAQQPSPKFDVASVRRAVPRTPETSRVTQNRLDYVNVSLTAVIMQAYRIEQYQLSGPDWLRDTGVDIHATFQEAAREQVPEMLQALLAERFGLVARMEPRRIDAYELVVGKDGHRMREVSPANEVDTALPDEKPAEGELSVRTRRYDSPEGESRSRTALKAEGLTISTVTPRERFERTTTVRGTTIVNATRISMATLVGVLRFNLGLPVVDKTGLAGLYQFKVELDQSMVTARIAKVDFLTGVSTFKAIEGLGLKLEERGSPFDVLVIEKIERTPTEN